MITLRKLLQVAVITAATGLLVSCGGGGGTHRTLLVEHSPDVLGEEVARLLYQVLDENGDWIPVPGESLPGVAAGVVTVPVEARVLVIEARDRQQELVGEQLHTVSSFSEGTVNHARWMTESPRVQAATLRRITIPGAHDAGMGKIEDCTLFANARTTRTQVDSIREMLASGVRYFDLRPTMWNNSSLLFQIELGPLGPWDLSVEQFRKTLQHMALGHVTWLGARVDLPLIGNVGINLGNQGCAGYGLVRALEDVRAFLDQPGHRELVILKMSHFKDLVDHDTQHSMLPPKAISSLEWVVTTMLRPYLLQDQPDFLDKPIGELTRDGPKVIVTFDEAGYDGRSGIYSQSDMNLHDEYSRESSLHAMRQDQFRQLRDYGAAMDIGDCTGCGAPARSVLTPNQPYFVMSWTLTQSLEQVLRCSLPEADPHIRLPVSWTIFKKAVELLSHCGSLQQLAAIANGRLSSVVSEVKKTRRFPHVIYVDNAGKGATDAAIAINALH